MTEQVLSGRERNMLIAAYAPVLVFVVAVLIGARILRMEGLR